jgi:hypothetical protein
VRCLIFGGRRTHNHRPDTTRQTEIAVGSLALAEQEDTMYRKTVVMPSLIILGALVALGACSREGSSPTGLAVGIGASSEAIYVSDPHVANPVESFSAKSTAAPDVHGTFSVEDFQGTQTNLSLTHDSADGFRAYLNNWYAHNFVYRDGTVGTWAFYDVAGGDNWDLWTHAGIDRGIDGALAVFNSSHGGMNASGRYTFCLGANWAGRGWNAYSTSMSIGGNDGTLGNERNRYIFWDTCQSVKWSGSHSPYRTWGGPANGVRMIFGYDTNSVDSSNYGRYFWEEWNKGKTLVYAFLDASWRINTGQSPCVVAFGSSSADAASRRDSERMLSWGAVSSSWGAWRWYYTAKSAGPGKRGELTLADVPSTVATRAIHDRGNSDDEVQETAESIGIRVDDERMIQNRPFLLRSVVTDDSTLFVDSDGDFELRLQRQVTTKAAAELSSDESLIERASQIVDQFGLMADSDYRVSDVRYLAQNTESADQKAGEPEIVERTVIFDQVIDDLAFIDPDAGHVEITFDAGADEIVGIRSTIRAVVPSYEKTPAERSARDLDEVRMIALHSFTASPVPNPDGSAKSIETLEIVAGSEKIGYQMIDGRAVPVYRALLQNPEFPQSKLHEAVIPLAATE